MKPLDLGRLRAWSAVPAPRFLGGNQVDLLEGGDALFPRMCLAIGQARREVWLATYIFHDDAASKAIAEALVEAAARGVAVHVVVDGFGTIATMVRVRACSRAVPCNWRSFARWTAGIHGCSRASCGAAPEAVRMR
jgi:cardiolipin synthase